VLAQAGIEKGDTVIIILGRDVAWWKAITALIRMGAVAAPGSTQLSSKDIAFRTNASKAKCIITDGANAQKVDEAEASSHSLKTKILVDGSRSGWLNLSAEMENASTKFETVNSHVDDEMLCYFTSGTTGHPKMTIHSHSYPLGHQTTGKLWLGLEKGNLHWNISDTGWAKAAWSSYFGPWLQGATVFAHNSNGFDAAHTLTLLESIPSLAYVGRRPSIGCLYSKIYPIGSSLI
jgi:acetyl-CoA synthetase/medium-chain acyl-CoA synthetase